MKHTLYAAAAAALMILPAMGFAASMQDDQAGDRATKALNLLQANGYTQFSNFRPAGNEFEATVTRNGQQSVVIIDPDSGRISSQMANAGNGSNQGISGSSMPSGSMSNGNGQWSQRATGTTGSSDKASRVYHDMYNPEGGAAPTVGVESSGAKKR
jgi:hypothetical protein